MSCHPVPVASLLPAWTVADILAVGPVQGRGMGKDGHGPSTNPSSCWEGTLHPLIASPSDNPKHATGWTAYRGTAHCNAVVTCQHNRLSVARSSRYIHSERPSSDCSRSLNLRHRGAEQSRPEWRVVERSGAERSGGVVDTRTACLRGSLLSMSVTTISDSDRSSSTRSLTLNHAITRCMSHSHVSAQSHQIIGY